MFAAQGIIAERRVVRLTDGSDYLVHKHQEMVFMNQMIFLSQMGMKEEGLNQEKILLIQLARKLVNTAPL